MKQDFGSRFEFLDQNGTFRFMNPFNIHELYLPLCNEAGLMSSVTPALHGDIKTDQHHFIMQPVTIEDLHNSKASRNFWFHVHGEGAWSAAGNSARQNSLIYDGSYEITRTVEAGLLWHKLTYHDSSSALTSEILSFVPVNEDRVEVMYVTVINSGSKDVCVTPTSAIPLYGRSADNVRDHRHVTSLVNRIGLHRYGVSMKPVIVFDERGHRYNHTIFFVFGCEQDGTLPVGSIPSAHDFIGKAGSYDWPEAVAGNAGLQEYAGEQLNGRECVGALRFRDAVLSPGDQKDYIILIGTCDDSANTDTVFERYNTKDKVMKLLQANKDHWNSIANSTTYGSGLKDFSNWMKWVNIQPVLRKIYGCSFLPHHDYGKGGRGWRDLWQDCLSLIIGDPDGVRDLLITNFGGVRVDGTNATIIGTKTGEFVADRNNIARVWMDHGCWPYITTKLYIDQSGDFSILLERQPYFRDSLVMRAAQRDVLWKDSQGLNLKTKDGGIYQGTVLEHLLVQHLCAFFNVGGHNMIRLEGADWNDTLDMAREHGESVAFSALYAGNLISLWGLLLKMKEELGIDRIEVFQELKLLLDSISGETQYNKPEYKISQLAAYLEAVNTSIAGTKAFVEIADLSRDLRVKGEWLNKRIREYEWIRTASGDGFFNGYYNNEGQRVDGEHEGEVIMNLTAQVFTAMYGLATDEQVAAGYQSCRRYLKDASTGGYRLNTDLGSNRLNFGRCFSFAYGEKENGSVFCHMVVIYSYALYKRGFVHEAYEVFRSLYDLSSDVEKSGIYPGIPEYFNLSGKGMYHYLTGSASWTSLLVLTEMYGVRGEYGELVIEPKLMAEQFDHDGRALVSAWFAGRKVNVKYQNSKRLDYLDYMIAKAAVNGIDISGMIRDGVVRIPKDIGRAETNQGKADLDIVLELG
ncbi:MAG: cellobiose phosphorylase [Clostridiaceae bacterium]